MRARNITMVVILFIVLVLVPETNIQAKTKKCNHKNVTWITTSKPSSNHVSLAGRQNGEEYDENRERGRQDGKGFFWKCTDAFPTGKQ